MKKIILIACVKEKLNQPAKAIDIYQGSLFKNWLSLADKIDYDFLFILSGKHGLLAPQKIIHPYDLNLNHQNNEYKKKWAKNVVKELKLISDLKKDQYIFLCEDSYKELITPFITFHQSL
tara:strand:+ start:402 stop:761 length:360 start_codon:yes stop_codon:yes gene_type:complete